MSRHSLKTPPAKGMVISGLWKYAIVGIVKDGYALKPKGTYDVFEMSKHKTLKQAEERCKDMNDNETEYALERGRKPPKRKYYLAEWTQNQDGEIVCLLIEEPAK